MESSLRIRRVRLFYRRRHLESVASANKLRHQNEPLHPQSSGLPLAIRLPNCTCRGATNFQERRVKGGSAAMPQLVHNGDTRQNGYCILGTKTIRKNETRHSNCEETRAHEHAAMQRELVSFVACDFLLHRCLNCCVVSFVGMFSRLGKFAADVATASSQVHERTCHRHAPRCGKGRAHVPRRCST